jgi:hypothetical protein
MGPVLGAMALSAGDPSRAVTMALTSMALSPSGPLASLGGAAGRGIGGALGLGEAGIGAAGLLGGLGAALIPAGLLAANNLEADVQRSNAMVRASVGDAMRLNDFGINGLTQRLFQTGVNYRYGGQAGYDVAGILGSLGVRAGQLTTADSRGGAVGSVLAAARQTQQSPQAIAELFGTLMTAGQQTLPQVTRAFQTLVKAAHDTSLPLNTLVKGMQSFASATGGAAISASSLAGVQALVGPAINVGTLLAPLGGATGANAFAVAAMLGTDVGGLQRLQGIGGNGQTNGVALLQGVSSFLRRVAPGPVTARSIATGEAVLQGTGLLNLNGVSPGLQAQLVRNLLSGNVTEASRLQGQLGGYAFASTEQWESMMLKSADDQTSWLSKIEQDTSAIARNTAHTIAAATSSPNQATSAADWHPGMTPPKGYQVVTTSPGGRFSAPQQSLVFTGEQGGPLRGTAHPSQVAPHFPSGEGVHGQQDWSSGRDTMPGGRSGFDSIPLAIDVSGTFRMEDANGNFIGTARMVPRSITHTINPGRTPVGFSHSTPSPQHPQAPHRRTP